MIHRALGLQAHDVLQISSGDGPMHIHDLIGMGEPGIVRILIAGVQEGVCAVDVRDPGLS